MQNQAVAGKAINIVAHAPRRNHAAFDIERRDAANREPVAPMRVRHGERMPDNARQLRNVHHLLHRRVGLKMRQQRFAGIDDAVHVHVSLLRHAPPAVINLFKPNFFLLFFRHLEEIAS